ncbi:hypothetical protein W97_04684 [Coniosporium apollinis CBS 100218]|uniref:Uncharacterized protein n=1 Tax=Coniosporium apollinis (strain CBS 100218) TaxID=1168221 RepID=R7YUS9_CONA1|nr:uncharacterized protein W97_04684 [Coniosporium apollinis CBS 100218]EON65446.1 hypothetical protein W97_04684 [Coniosporium apollinis CBS 100218]
MGLAITKTLLERGASLGLCDLNGASLKKLFNSLTEEQKSRVIIQVLDIADRGTGGHKLGPESIWETEDREMEYIVDVNIKGLFHVLAEALKPGVLEEPGSVVHVRAYFRCAGIHKVHCLAPASMRLWEW